MPPPTASRAPTANPSPAWLAGLLRDAAPVELLEPLAWELGDREVRRTLPSLSRAISEGLGTGDAAAARMIALTPPARAVLRFLVGRMAVLLAARPAGARLIEDARRLAPPPYAGPVTERPERVVAALAGAVAWTGESVELTAPPEVILRGAGAQVAAGAVRARAGTLVESAGEHRAHRLAVDALGAALPAVARVPALADPRTWDLRVWRAAAACGWRVGADPGDNDRALARLAGATPAECLSHLFHSYAAETTAEAPSAVELFGPSAWRLGAACEQPAAPVVYRIQSLYALETLPVDAWVEVPRFVDHLYRQGLLPPTCRGVVRTLADPRMVPVTSMRPDHNEGEPFRMRVPHLLRAVLGAPAQLGLVDLALAPRGESVVRFSGSRWRQPVCEAPYVEVTHLRRTSLGARWLDPLPPPTGSSSGPGVDGLDALADLLG